MARAVESGLALRCSLVLGAVTLLALLGSWLTTSPPALPVLHGHSDAFLGSCYCGVDKYCLCTPSLAIDAVIEVTLPQDHQLYVVLVFRRDPPSGFYAIPGGFVNVGETVEAATIREVREETNLELDRLEQFRVYSDPRRDKRRHTASVVFRCVPKNSTGLRSGDDAKRVELVRLRDVLGLRLAFDHRQILTDYIRAYHPSLLEATSL